MQVKGAVVVVTGAGGGIGGALARRFVADGAAAVVVSDVNAEAVEKVAADLGDTAHAAVTDVSSAEQMADLVARVERDHGPIELFCSNAGIATGVGLGADPATWERAWSVNVLAHVHAARAVVPAMLERGRGYLLNTASAAGLLTQPSDAPYAVTKHAAVGFAEWLAFTYGGSGIGVSVLCPMGVRTDMLMSGIEQDDPAALAVAASGDIVTPEAVADAVAAGLAEERFLILPHPDVARMYAKKAADPDRWLAGMRKAFG